METPAPTRGPSNKSSLTLTAAYANTIAGILLTLANVIGMSYGAPVSQNPNIDGIWKVLMFAEGFLFALAAFLLHVFQKDVMRSRRGAIAQMFIVFGGGFFAISAYNDLYGLLPEDKKMAMQGLSMSMFHAHTAYFGITCFMTGTVLAFSTVFRLPWNVRTPNPKTGVFFFLFGAWTIGLFTMLGGYAKGLEWHLSVGRYAAVIGAISLTLGASIFQAMEYQ